MAQLASLLKLRERTLVFLPVRQRVAFKGVWVYPLDPRFRTHPCARADANNSSGWGAPLWANSSPCCCAWKPWWPRRSANSAPSSGKCERSSAQ
jgi:hypothetical protein